MNPHNPRSSSPDSPVAVAARRGRGPRRSPVRILGLTLAALLLNASGALALNPTPAQLFYVPFPEGQLLQGLQSINGAASNPMTTYISIAAVAPGTIVYYDQWENGYDADIANPANLYSSPGNLGGTQIWGDGNPANGFPPGLPGDLINAGTVIVLSNTVDTSTPLAIDFDGRDKLAATKTVAVSRTGWSTGPNTLLAGSVEVFDTSNWGTDYRSPVGVDIPDGTDQQMFEFTSLAILAGEGGANIQIDKENDGIFEIAQSLNEGESYFVNGGVEVGGRVISDKPVQVDILTGDIGSTYESRDSALLPVSLWSTSYYEPVSTVSSAGTTVWLYNPGGANLTVAYTTRNGIGALTTTNLVVPAGSYLPQVIPDGYGAHFKSVSQPFYAFSTTDSTSATTGGNQSWDWSFTLVPEDSLTPQVLIGLGIGRDPTSPTNPNENGNPVWVTPVGNLDTPVTVYVDYDADPLTGPLTDPNGNKYDVALSLKELERAKIYDPNDRNQTGMLVYVLAPGIKLAAAWGQDPSAASAGAPGLDVGTGVPPLPLFSAGKNGTLFTDNDGDGFVSPGDVLLYTIAITNISRAPVPDILLKDELPAGTTYVASSTTFEDHLGVVTPIADNGVGTPFPLDGAGVVVNPLTALPVGGAYEVTFKVTIGAFASLQGADALLNVCTAEAVGIEVKCPDLTPLFGRIGDFVWLDLDGDGIQDGGPEVGIPSVTVNLYVDLNGDGIINGGDGIIATQITSASGGYLFTGVPAGNYVVDVVNATVPAGLSLTTANDPTAVSLAGGEWRLDVDFGYRNLCDGVVCNNGDACNDPGVCVPATGQCSAPTPKPNGTTCSDGNACTQTDTCQGGVCGGTNPVVCGAPGQCQGPGTCDPQTGACSFPPANDGTPCNDGSLCTQTDTCTGGTCGGTPITCPAPGECHLQGTCNPQTGQCSNPVAQDGTQCSDGNACTVGDACQGGGCAPGSPLQCTALDECHVPGVCNPQTGQCTNPTATDGTACDDGSQCTAGDQCVGGVCQGVIGDCLEVCTDQDDNDDDGLIDCLDPDCPNCTPITNPCGHPCVTQILFQRRGLDLIRLQASFKPATPADPLTEQVGLLITNANGVVFADMLPPGAMKKAGKAWAATVKSAKTGGGIFKIKILLTADGSYRFNVRAYEEMSASATLASMSVQLVIGDDAAVTTSTWAQIKAGWRVQLP